MFVFAHAECSCEHNVGGDGGQGGGVDARRAGAAALLGVGTEFSGGRFLSGPSEGDTSSQECKVTSSPAALSLTVPLSVSHDLKISIPHLMMIIISPDTFSLPRAIKFCTEILLSFMFNDTTNDKKRK